MLTKIMKWVSMAALLLTAIFWDVAADYQLVLDFVVCTGAFVVILQAVRAKEYRWAAGFVAIGLLFSPVVPAFKLSGELSLLLVLVCIAPFAVSLAALKTQPLLSIPSITDRNPGSESL